MGNTPQLAQIVLEGRALAGRSASTLADYEVAIARAAIEACAREVYAWECICLELDEETSAATIGRGGDDEPSRVVRQHDPRCPEALASRLREISSE